MKPKICKILGVELDRPFTYDGAQYRICETEYGLRLETEDVDKLWYLVDSTEALEMIEHPEKAKRGRWTERDITDADDLQFIMPDLVKVERADTERVGDIRLWTKDGTFSWISREMFPSLQVGEKVGLDEILGGAK